MQHTLIMINQFNLVAARKYRDDITGLRAIAVIAVTIFHLGYLPNGYLGVDIFFVISGFLITNIIINELNENNFSIGNFYIRRIRRILPLSLFITAIALLIGIGTMLPDDLENLAQSVVATNFFSNNILQAITTKNYWDVVNEYKPLMHTWSLGIEEQFYLAYPILIAYLYKKQRKLLVPALSLLIIVSIALYLAPNFEAYKKFYYLPFRFYELAVGGLAALLSNNKILSHKLSPLLIAGILSLLFIDTITDKYLIILTVIVTSLILLSANEKSITTSIILENKPMLFIGSISFSLYMWHQVLLAYTRYFITDELNIFYITSFIVAILILSTISYKFIEQPFRNKSKINNKYLAIFIIILFVTTTSAGLYIYINSGVLNDIPELSIYKHDIKKNMHSAYNHRNYLLDKEFTSTENSKVLVIGNSFARDWINVLRESDIKNIEISYVYNPNTHENFYDRAKLADIIFYSTPNINDIDYNVIEKNKLWVIGTKNFGFSNGIHYNYRGENYYSQRTRMVPGYLEENEKMKNIWKNRYINYIDHIIDVNQTVPVFTPTQKFISQDCRHLTQAGAIFFADIFEEKINTIFNSQSSIE